MLPYQARDAATAARLSTLEPRPPKRRMLRVEYERRLRGMSQASLAEALGVSQSLVSHVERGGPPGRHVALKIQRLFELPTPEACVEEVR